MIRAATRFFSVLFLPAVLQASDAGNEVDRAGAAVEAFGAALKSELMAAMQSGGALEAIQVCHARADEIAENISREAGMKVSRISARNRNPANAAGDWQMEVLRSFEERKQAGESPAMLTWSQTVETGTGNEFRFMKAIPTAGLCLQCHGTAIAPEVSAKIRALYPGDRATGYSEGDIRGAFLVTDQVN